MTVYSIEPGNPLVLLSCLFMLMSACSRIAYFRRERDGMSRSARFIHIVLPLSCNILYALTLPLLGKHALWATSLPVVLGTLFFALKAQTFGKIHKLLCRLLYLAVAALYTCTVTGVIPTQRLLIPLFGLPLLFHLTDDLLSLRRVNDKPSLHTYLPEISVLLIMASLLFASISIKKGLIL